MGPGASREDVINAYGWPSGFSQAGAKEILTYPQGQITLQDGRVERVDFSPNVPWPPPRPRPAPPTASTAKKTPPSLDRWLERFDDAQKDARRRNVRILALFVGSDWSPPSKQFLDEVALHPEFGYAFSDDFVLLRLDYPTRAAQPAEIREQNARLRETYAVTTYPALLVLSAEGAMLATVDLTVPRGGDSLLARVTAAVSEARDVLIGKPRATRSKSGEAAPVAQPVAVPQSAATAAVSRAMWLAIGGVAIGLVLAGIGVWWVWRMRMPAPGPRNSQMAERISRAASGLPPVAEIAEWSGEKLRAVVGRLAASEGYDVKPRAGGSDGDLALRHGGQTAPSVIVSCQAGTYGPASAKRLRELFGIITVEGVKTGWFVSPAGFSREARDYADEHRIVLIDTEQLLAQMRSVPPIMLQKILAD